MKMFAWLLVVSIALILLAGTEVQADLPTRELVQSELLRGDPHEPERAFGDLSGGLPFAGDAAGEESLLVPSSWTARAGVVRLHLAMWAPTLLFSMI